MGYTHGVRLVSTPPRNTAGIALNGLDRFGRKLEISIQEELLTGGRWVTSVCWRKPMSQTKFRTLAVLAVPAVSMLLAATMFPLAASAQGGQARPKPGGTAVS